MIEKTPRIYSAKLTPEQNAAMARYESLCGNEPFGFEAFEAGELTAYQLWQQNVKWLEDVLSEVSNTHFPVPLEEVIADADNCASS